MRVRLRLTYHTPRCPPWPYDAPLQGKALLIIHKDRNMAILLKPSTYTRQLITI